MSQRKNLCVLVVEVVGRDRLIEVLGSKEATHAIERCIHRVDRAIAANNGETLRSEGDRICAAFERCDAGILAACEMLDRVLCLPPLRGLRMTVRVGVHYGGVFPPGEPAGDGEQIATRLAVAARRGQALASGAVAMLLSAATRHFVGTEAVHSPDLEGLEWPVFALGRHVGMVTSIPPAIRVSQRLRIRHQQDVLFVEDQRPIVLFGRELGNDVVIIDPRASRQHVRIERRREGFFLVDQSTNGTFVVEEDGKERCLKRSEVALVGPGRIGCGFSANEVERDLVFFEIV